MKQGLSSQSLKKSSDHFYEAFQSLPILLLSGLKPVHLPDLWVRSDPLKIRNLCLLCFLILLVSLN